MPFQSGIDEVMVAYAPLCSIKICDAFFYLGSHFGTLSCVSKAQVKVSTEQFIEQLVSEMKIPFFLLASQPV